LANCRDVWKRGCAYLARYRKVNKGDTFEEWLHRRQGEDTVTGEFRRYSIAGSVILVTETFDPIAWSSRPDTEEAFLTLQPGLSIHSLA
jgi:hypothetical protein